MSNEIPFLGQPILAFNNTTNNTKLSARYRGHRWIRDQFFLSVPMRLWELLGRELRDFDFDEDSLCLEHDVSQIMGDHGSSVGYWNESPIHYHLMRKYTLEIPPAAALQSVMGDLNPTQMELRLRTLEERSQRFLLNARGYAGWLMTNRTFLEEHDALVEQWSPQLCRWGSHLVGVPIPPHMPSGPFNPTSEPGWNDFHAAILSFLVRWRLRNLAAPTLPTPIQPIMGGDFPMSILQQLIRAGGVFNWPDIAPIPSREELRDILEDAVRGGQSPEHLAEWMDIVDGGNTARNKISRFARLFELQHYWRVLCGRYPNILEGNIGLLEQVFSEFLSVSVDTIHSDLMLVRERLGQDWVQFSHLPTVN